jgi:hypothetical protein
MNLRFLEIAKVEFWKAAAHYEQEREGLAANLHVRSPKRSTGLRIIPTHGVRFLHERDNVVLTDFLTPSCIR